MTTCGPFHSHRRMKGLRRPAATSSTRVSSMATLIIGSTTGPWMTSKSMSSHDRAAPRARRTAMPTASGVTPMSVSPSWRAPATRAARSLALDEARAPSRDAVIRVSASSGSRKKSPDTLTRARRSSSTSVSTTTSLPPGTLYSPCMPTIVGASLTPSRAGRARRPCRRTRRACRTRAARRRPCGGAAWRASTARHPFRRGGARVPRRSRSRAGRGC